MITIEVTNICNAKCSFCPREKMTRPIGVMDFELFKKIIDECAKNRVSEVNITGYGEPLADKGLVEKIKYIKSKYNPIVTMTTNGSLLTENLVRKLIDSGLDEFCVSFYSTKKENQPKGISHERISANLKRFSELRKEMNKKLPRLVARFTCNTANKDEVEAWKKEWIGVVDGIVHQNLMNFVYGRSYNCVEKSNMKISCLHPEKKIQVEWDGNVIACCFDFDEKVVLGNVKENSIFEILQKKEYKELLKNLALRRFNNLPLCKDCDQLIPLTLDNVLKRIFYLGIKGPIERRERKNLFVKLRG
jgi:radical SAM protein with 4Fe4S-binding SPASM domain